MTPPPSTQRCVAGRAGSGMTEPPALGMYQRTRRATLMGQPLTKRTGTMDLRGLGITAGLAVALGGIVGGAVAVSAYEPQPQEPVRLIAPMAGEVTTTDTPTTTTATEVPTVTATPTTTQLGAVHRARTDSEFPGEGNAVPPGFSSRAGRSGFRCGSGCRSHQWQRRFKTGAAVDAVVSPARLPAVFLPAGGQAGA